MSKYCNFQTNDDDEMIGDVGVVDKGHFRPYFNITMSCNHKRNRRRGVPEGFEPIHFTDDDVDLVSSSSIPLKPWAPLCRAELQRKMSATPMSDK